MDSTHSFRNWRPTLAVVALLVLLIVPAALDAASLRPSRSGLLRQVRAARAHDYSYLRNEQEVRRFVDKGLLVRLTGNRDYTLKRSVPFPYARPEVRIFVERLGSQYRRSCGEKLVVTSLVRPKNRQPRNSSRLSVHPTGMAMDLRVSKRRACRRWIEDVLLQLERRGVLEAARERYPPHYHVVLFPRQYVTYLTDVLGVEVALPAAAADAYRVRPGDSLWSIARRHNTSVQSLRRENHLRSNVIKPGQVLKIPRS